MEQQLHSKKRGAQTQTGHQYQVGPSHGMYYCVREILLLLQILQRLYLTIHLRHIALSAQFILSPNVIFQTCTLSFV